MEVEFGVVEADEEARMDSWELVEFPVIGADGRAGKDSWGLVEFPVIKAAASREVAIPAPA